MRVAPHSLGPRRHFPCFEGRNDMMGSGRFDHHEQILLLSSTPHLLLSLSSQLLIDHWITGIEISFGHSYNYQTKNIYTRTSDRQLLDWTLDKYLPSSNLLILGYISTRSVVLNIASNFDHEQTFRHRYPIRSDILHIVCISIVTKPTESGCSYIDFHRIIAACLGRGKDAPETYRIRSSSQASWNDFDLSQDPCQAGCRCCPYSKECRRVVRTSDA